MKKILITFSLVVLCFVSFNSCSSDDETLDPIETRDIDFEINVPYAQTYKMPKVDDGTYIVNKAYILIPDNDSLKVTRAEGIEYIKNFSVELLDDTQKKLFTIEKSTINPQYGIYVKPIEEAVDEFFSEHDALLVPIRVTAEDMYGRKKIEEHTLRFYVQEVIVPANESGFIFAYNNESSKTVNIAPYLQKIGITKEFAANHQKTISYIDFSSYATLYDGSVDLQPMGVSTDLDFSFQEKWAEYAKTGVFSFTIEDFGMDITDDGTTYAKLYAKLFLGFNDYMGFPEEIRLLVNSTLKFEIVVE